MMEYTLNGKKICFVCDERLQQEADFFAEILEQEDKTQGVLEDGKTICIGWSYYKVLQVEEKFHIQTVDLAGNPFQEVEEDLSLSLEIFGAQLKIIKETGMTPDHVTFQDVILIRKSAVHASGIYLQRSEPVSEEDSGWYMGALEDTESNDPEDYTRIYTYQLLSICKQALSVLSLPVGVIAVFQNGELVEIVDGDDKLLYQS